MTETEGPAVGLDVLSSRARAGDAAAENALLADLRVRFLDLAKRRVGEEEAEDLVQDALRVVHEKHPARPSPDGFLPWALTVLRNVIGNHYQRARRRDRVEGARLDDIPGRGAAPVGPVSGPEGEDGIAERLTEAIGRLAAEHEKCGHLFRILLQVMEEADGPRAVSRLTMERARAEVPELTTTNFHVTLHRCRGRLRLILEALEAGEAR